MCGESAYTTLGVAIVVVIFFLFFSFSLVLYVGGFLDFQITRCSSLSRAIIVYAIYTIADFFSIFSPIFFFQ